MIQSRILFNESGCKVDGIVTNDGVRNEAVLYSSFFELALSSSSSFSGDLNYTYKTHGAVAAGGSPDTDTKTGGGTGEGLFEEIEDGGIIGVSSSYYYYYTYY